MKLRPYPKQSSPASVSRCMFFWTIMLIVLPAAINPAFARTKEYTIGPRPAWVRSISYDEKSVVPVEQVSQGVYYLLSDQQVRVAAKNKVTYRHFAEKAVNEAGVEEIAHVEIHFDPSYQTLTLHSIKVRRGKAVTSKLKASAVRVLQRETDLEYRIYDGAKTANVFLDDVRVGDIVEYDYTVSGTNPVFGGRQFGQFELQWKVPVWRAYNRLLWPAGRKLYVAHHNTAVKPREGRLNGDREYQWDVKTPQPLVLEADAPGWYDPYAWVQWSEFKDWASVARWAAPLYRVPGSHAALQKEVERIAQASADPHERVLAVLRFVQGEIRYLGVEIGANSHAPRHPRDVLARRFGDCKDKALLTVSMLRGLGIEAHPALVNTSLRRGILDLHPTPGAFNHVIVHVRLDDRDHWIDPTRSLQMGDFAHLHQPDYGYALVLDAATRSLSSMENASRIFSRSTHAVLDMRAGTAEPVVYTITSVFEGGSADAIRNSLSSENREELQKQYLNFYARSYPGLAVKTPFTVAEEESANRVTITEQYVIRDFWKRNEAKKRKEAAIYEPDVQDWFTAPRTPVRQSPLGIAHPFELKHVTEVLLPEAWNTKQTRTVVDDAAFQFERTVTERDKILRLEDHYRSRTDFLAPGDTAKYVADLDRARDSLDYTLYQNDSVPALSRTIVDRINWSVAMAALLFLLPLTWLAIRLYRYDPSPSTQSADTQIKNIGGWLILPAIGVITTPIRIFVEFIQTIPTFSSDSWSLLTTAGSTAYHAMWAPVLLFELGGNLAQLVFSLMLVILFFKKRRSVPAMYIGFLIASGILQAADLLLTRSIPSAAASIGVKDWNALVVVAMSLAIWGSYFMVSKRVKATFVNVHGDH